MTSIDPPQTKELIRRESLGKRTLLSEKAALSEKILDRLFRSKIYTTSRTVLYYVDIRSEVRTRDHLKHSIDQGKRVFVPRCADNYQLELYELASPKQLENSAFGLLEPSAEFRSHDNLRSITEVDLALIPGVSFGRDCSRIGYGRAYFDNLLSGADRTRTKLVGLAFECQMRDSLPVEKHDVFMDYVLTEAAVYCSTEPFE